MPEDADRMAADAEWLTATRRGWRLLAARREALAAMVAAQPGAWMGIPGWARWFRKGYRLLGRDLGEPAHRQRS